MDTSAHFASSSGADDNGLLIERVGDDYYRELVCESAIDPLVALERGYYNSGYDWPHLVDDLGFSKRAFADRYVEPTGCDCAGGELYWPEWAENNQIGLPALVVPRRSPDGERVTYEIKPKTHSFKDDRKYINPPNQELTLDVHPRGFKHLQDVSTPVWITEGAKKADSLTTLGLFAINISGVWGFQQKKVHGEDDPVLPCFDYIEWEDRQVILAFDADARVNQNIQDALSRLNRILLERGAEVLVIYTPPVHGDNSAGIDDFLASGDDPVRLLHRLLVSAAPYSPVDVTHERLSRNPDLREHIEGMEQYLLAGDWKRRTGARSTLKGLLSVARRDGKVVEKESGKCILVQASYRFIAEQEKMSKETVVDNIKKMEKQNLVLRDRTIPRKQKDPMYFLICSERLLRDRYNSGEKESDTHTSISSFHVVPVLHPSNPRLRNSAHRYGLNNRIGKRGETILDTMMVISDGGSEYVEESRLSEMLHYKNLKSMRDSKVYKRLLSWGILDNEIVEGSVRLTPDWRSHLRMAMDDRLEHLSDEKQAHQHGKQRRRFKEGYRDTQR